MPNNTNTGSKKIYNSADLVNMAQKDYDAINEQDILNKYNQATSAQFAAQQDQNRIAENNFYNQMYNTQRTAMDTIRQSNATAVSTGASRGVQAANELSALLGLQQESIASATEIANARRQTAQEETAAMLQNIVQASQDAAAQRTQAMQNMIQAQSLRESELANASAAADRQLTAVTESGEAYNTYLEQEGKLGPDGEFAREGYTVESDLYIKNQFDSKTIQLGLTEGAWQQAVYKDATGVTQLRTEYEQQLTDTCTNVGIDEETYQSWRKAELAKKGLSEDQISNLEYEAKNNDTHDRIKYAAVSYYYPPTLKGWIATQGKEYNCVMVNNQNYDTARSESIYKAKYGVNQLLDMNKYRKGKSNSTTSDNKTNK